MTCAMDSMRIAQAALNVLVVNAFGLSADWAWGLPLIVLTVVIHVVGLEFVSQRAFHVASGVTERRHSKSAFAILMGATTLFATCLHAVEAAIWAAVYRLLGALPDFRSSALYSLNAMTSYGHTNLFLEDRWQLMGALEALNGWLLFGLTTAFLFAVLQKAWLLGGKRVQHDT